jgi:hypothetical protein
MVSYDLGSAEIADGPSCFSGLLPKRFGKLTVGSLAISARTASPMASEIAMPFGVASG